MEDKVKFNENIRFLDESNISVTMSDGSVKEYKEGHCTICGQATENGHMYVIGVDSSGCIPIENPPQISEFKYTPEEFNKSSLPKITVNEWVVNIRGDLKE